jgi:signal transduction histidine kinase
VSRRPKQLGLRREVLLFLPLAVLLLAIIASFNLLVYRNVIEELESERLEEAEWLARRAASRLSSGPGLSPERLEQLAPTATAVVVFDSSGRLAAQAGTPVPLDPSGFEPPTWPEDAKAFAPLEIDAPTIAAVAPFERNGQTYLIQIDLPARRLASHRLGLRRILVFNVIVLTSLTVLVLLFARRLLQPWESLLERARSVDSGSPDDAAGDEVTFLVDTFERALEALGERASGNDDEIAFLERTLAPSLESGFMLLDADGRVLAVNEIGARLLEIESPDEPIDIRSLLESHPRLAGRISNAISRGAPIQRDECQIETREGQRIIGLTVHPLRRDDRELRGFIGLYADLTSVREDERRAQLDRSLAQLGELSAGMAHEMRNGLATLKGYLGLIEHGADEDSVLDYLREMRTESEHLERVLTDFLSFARPGTLRLEPVSLLEVARRATADPTLADVEIVVRSDADLPQIEGDPQLLDRAVRNLLQNAADAQRSGDAGNPIEVEIRRSPRGVVVRIVDTGPGLDEGIRERLFQPFVSGRADGVGLGLALAHRIAHLHGGELAVEDRRPRGVEATLDLPVRNDT